MNFTKRPPSKKLNLQRRYLGMTALEMSQADRIESYLLSYARVFNRVKYSIAEEKKEKMKDKIIRLHRCYCSLVRVPDELRDNEPLPPLHRRHRTIDSFLDNEIPIFFRFRTKDQLHCLIAGFQIPHIFRSDSGHVFHGEETLLVSLYRLHRPTTVGDSGFKTEFGIYNSQVSECVHCFLGFIIPNWKYLLTDNMDFWVPYMAEFAQAISNKVQELSGFEFPNSDEIGGLSVYAFIDNTNNVTC